MLLMRLSLFVLFTLQYIAFALVQVPIPKKVQRNPALDYNDTIVDSVCLKDAPYPIWAHYHWVWLASGVENQGLETALVKDYLAHDIPVGGVDIDSEWSTGINNFIWDEKKFANATAMIETFHSLGVRVIAWATSVVNTDSSNYEEGKKNDYYLNGGSTIKWWHGRGSWIDYTNKAGLDWWHKQMDYVIDIGLDGWKCDGTDPFVFEFEPYIHGKGGWISERDYANSYYRDFFQYTRTKNDEALIMARPVNDYWSFAPHDVLFAGWVGDNDATWSGLNYALNDIMHSAWRNYLNFGSDTGGYRSNGAPPLGRTKELLLRWAQLNSFLPLFENGGNKEHRPWKFGGDTTSIYRTFAHIHTEMAPMLLASGANCYKKGVSQVYPLGYDIGGIYPTSWDYLLGYDHDIYVSPIVSNTTTHMLTFPTGVWVDWWNNTKTYKGGETHTLNYGLSTYPVFKRAGALFPLQIESSYSKRVLLPTTHANLLTIFVTHPQIGGKTYEWAEWKSCGRVVTFAYDGHDLHLNVSAHSQGIVFVVRGVDASSVSATVIQAPKGHGTQNSVLESVSVPVVREKALFAKMPIALAHTTLENEAEIAVKISDRSIVRKGVSLTLKIVHK